MAMKTTKLTGRSALAVIIVFTTTTFAFGGMQALAEESEPIAEIEICNDWADNDSDGDSVMDRFERHHIFCVFAYEC